MKIMIIDDLEKNQKSAEALRDHGHEVIIIGTTEEAVRAFRKDAPDMVLTDLWMPAPPPVPWAPNCSAVRLNCTPYNPENDQHRTPEVPVGLIVAILARNAGVKRIAILTDADHHNDQIIALCGQFRHEDGYGYNWEDRGVDSICLFETRYFENDDGSKNWCGLAEKMSE